MKSTSAFCRPLWWPDLVGGDTGCEANRRETPGDAHLSLCPRQRSLESPDRNTSCAAKVDPVGASTAHGGRASAGAYMYRGVCMLVPQLVAVAFPTHNHTVRGRGAGQREDSLHRVTTAVSEDSQRLSAFLCVACAQCAGLFVRCSMIVDVLHARRTNITPIRTTQPVQIYTICSSPRRTPPDRNTAHAHRRNRSIQPLRRHLTTHTQLAVCSHADAARPLALALCAPSLSRACPSRSLAHAAHPAALHLCVCTAMTRPPERSGGPRGAAEAFVRPLAPGAVARRHGGLRLTRRAVPT